MADPKCIFEFPRKRKLTGDLKIGERQKSLPEVTESQPNGFPKTSKRVKDGQTGDDYTITADSGNLESRDRGRTPLTWKSNQTCDNNVLQAAAHVAIGDGGANSDDMNEVKYGTIETQRTGFSVTEDHIIPDGAELSDIVPRDSVYGTHMDGEDTLERTEPENFISNGIECDLTRHGTEARDVSPNRVKEEYTPGVERVDDDVSKDGTEKITLQWTEPEKDEVNDHFRDSWKTFNDSEENEETEISNDLSVEKPSTCIDNRNHHDLSSEISINDEQEIQNVTSTPEKYQDGFLPHHRLSYKKPLIDDTMGDMKIQQNPSETQTKLERESQTIFQNQVQNEEPAPFSTSNRRTDSNTSKHEAIEIMHKDKNLDSYIGMNPTAFLDSLKDVHKKEITLVVEPPKKIPKSKSVMLTVEDDNTAKSVGVDNMAYVIADDDRQITVPKIPRKSIRYSIHSLVSQPNESKLKKKLGRFFVLFGAFSNCFFSMGIVFSMGTFLPSWLEEFKDTRANTALIQSFLVGCVFGAGIFVGILIDRYGLKLVTCCGSSLACCGLIGAFFCQSTTALMLSIGLLTGIGSSCVQLGSIVSVSVTFKHSASLAIGVITAGGGLGGSTMPYINQYLIATYGWRGAFFIVAGLALQTLATSLLMTSFMKQAVGGNRTTAKVTLSVKEKLTLICQPRFIVRIFTSLSGFAATNGFVFILMDFADRNNGDGVFYLFLLTIVSTTSRLGFGAINMMKFVNSSVLLGMAVMFAGISLIGLSMVQSYTSTVALLVFFGINYGGLIGILGIVVLDFVGRDAFSLALGITATFNGSASSIGGAIYGLLYDLTLSYTTSLLTFGCLATVGGTLLLLLAIIDKICQSGIMNRVNP